VLIIQFETGLFFFVILYNAKKKEAAIL